MQVRWLPRRVGAGRLTARSELLLLLHAQLHVRRRLRLLLRHLHVGMIRDARSVGWRAQSISQEWVSGRVCECAE